jgi:UDP-N-acetylmuramoyl-tripeptide--D-alanyl-D-alanine ligase
MELRVADILAATGGRLLQGSEAVPFTGVSTDTRALAPGELFAALLGPDHDGHNYTSGAVKAGAAALLVSRWPVPCPPDLPVVLVDDTTRSYGLLGAWWRRQLPARIIGITGSNGKTTTKDMVACLLSGLGPTVATLENHNNHIGVPQTLLRIRPEHRFAVVEMGTNHVGEIEYLARLARPDVAVITNIGPAHLEAFGSKAGVQREKAQILRFTASDGLAVFHAAENDPWSRELAEQHSGRKTTFGTSPDANWRAVGVRVGVRSISFRVARSAVRFRVPVVGEVQIDNCLAALAVASEMGMSLSDAAERLRSFVAPSLRMTLRRLGELTLIEDCYNANPASMVAAIGDLIQRPARRRVAVLGDMLELGAVADAEHEALGQLVGAGPISLLCVVGERAALVTRAAVGRGLPEPNVFGTRDAAAAIAWLRERLCRSDTVLVKGSRGIRLENISKAIEAWASPAAKCPAA